VSLPETLPDADGVQWYPNALRATRLQRDRILLRLAAGGGFLALIGLGLALLAGAWPDLPALVGVGGGALLFLAVVTVLAALLPFTPRHQSWRSWYSPVRVGFSSQGIHVTYGAKSPWGHRETARAFIAWDSIEGLAPPISPYMR